jgi:hypothetical protein
VGCNLSAGGIRRLGPPLLLPSLKVRGRMTSSSDLGQHHLVDLPSAVENTYVERLCWTHEDWETCWTGPLDIQRAARQCGRAGLPARPSPPLTAPSQPYPQAVCSSPIGAMRTTVTTAHHPSVYGAEADRMSPPRAQTVLLHSPACGET